MTSLACSTRVAAGVWASQPVLGLSSDYSSNPGLLAVPDTAETHAAFLFDAPTAYTGDALKVTLLPSVRLSDSQGYSSLDSDYEHLNVSGEFDTERSVVTAAGGLARDSSLYHDYLLSGSLGVRRDTATADANWDRHVSERFDFDTDVSYVDVRYARGPLDATLTDYDYASVAPTLAWNQSERGKLTLAAGAGRYDSRDGTTRSTNANLQAGFVEQISDIWSVNAVAGYSRANNRIDTNIAALIFTPNGAEIISVPERFKSDQTGTVYSVTVSRQTERLALVAAASRQLVPTGFAFLSRQETYDLKLNYSATERFSIGGELRRLRYQQPGGNGVDSALNITSLQFSAAWRWTEQWTVSVGALRLLERYGAPGVNISSNAVSVEVSRQFNLRTFP